MLRPWTCIETTATHAWSAAAACWPVSTDLSEVIRSRVDEDAGCKLKGDFSWSSVPEVSRGGARPERRPGLPPLGCRTLYSVHQTRYLVECGEVRFIVYRILSFLHLHCSLLLRWFHGPKGTMIAGPLSSPFNFASLASGDGREGQVPKDGRWHCIRQACPRTVEAVCAYPAGWSQTA